MTTRYRPTALERAFELARLGACDDITNIIRRLKQEGYGGGEQVDGPVLRKQLRRLIQEARLPLHRRAQ